MKNALLAAGVLALAAQPATSWEGPTHAGLTEAAALSSGVHAVLQRLGAPLGLYQGLAVPPGTERSLFEILARLDPSEGLVPDRTGQMTALSWLTAGAVIQDMFPPLEPLGMSRFLTELEAAAVAPSPQQREQHLALAILCAGTMAGDLEHRGSPPRARLDEDESPLGGGLRDRGSRFERLAALSHGRLGIAPPRDRVAHARREDFFSSLAERTARRWYSSGTLPDPVDLPEVPSELVRRVVATQRFPTPAPELLDLGAAALRDSTGVCLANYHLEGPKLRRLRWSISDECAAEQVSVILPEITRVTSGFLAFLFRGSLTVSPQGEVTTDFSLGPGTVRLFAEDGAGQRTVMGEKHVTTAARGASLATFAPPQGTARVVAVFRGQDENGEELVAIGQSP